MSLNLVRLRAKAAYSKLWVPIVLAAMFSGGCTPVFSQTPTTQPAASPVFVEGRASPVTLPTATAGPTPELAATVNGLPVLLDDLQRELAALAPDGASDGIATKPPADLQAAVLNRLIDQRLIEQQAQQLGVNITDAELAAASDRLIAEADTPLESWLALNRMTAGQFQQTLKQEMLAERLFNRQTQHIAPAVTQVRLFYLWVGSEPLAQHVSQRLQEVGDFSQVSQEEQSYNPGNAGGGYLDWFSAGSNLLPPEVETLAFSLEPGKIGGPIPAAGRYYFVELAEKESDRLLPAAQLHQLKQAAFEQWLTEQRNAANIQIFAPTE